MTPPPRPGAGHARTAGQPDQTLPRVRQQAPGRCRPPRTAAGRVRVPVVLMPPGAVFLAQSILTNVRGRPGWRSSEDMRPGDAALDPLITSFPNAPSHSLDFTEGWVMLTLILVYLTSQHGSQCSGPSLQKSERRSNTSHVRSDATLSVSPAGPAVSEAHSPRSHSTPPSHVGWSSRAFTATREQVKKYPRTHRHTPIRNLLVYSVSCKTLEVPTRFTVPSCQFLTVHLHEEGKRQLPL